MRFSHALPLLLFVPCVVGGDPAGIEFFEKKIRPVLVEHCYKCHSTETKTPKGGLRLDTRDALRKGGDTGPGLIPGKPDESLLIKAIRHTDDQLKMPPKGKLSAAAVADLEAWIKMGAPDPRDRAAVVKSTKWEEILRERRGWWSLQPVGRSAVPEVRGQKSEVRSAIDAYLLEKLSQKALQSAATADRRTLVRRLSFVLTGLPPTPGEIAAALNDATPDWYERQVERLLASPHFGERWARHWMDVVRFTETHGNEWNYEVHHAWRYRDYLIRACNEDVPYDRFVREHIAGDLLAEQRWHARDRFNESVLGTAFYRFGEVNHDDCIALRQIGYDLADNQLDTLTKAFQATTAACARCHDHKIDAVSMKDYYALLGIIRSARQVSHTLDGPSVNAEPMARMTKLKAEIRKELGEAWLKQAKDISAYLLAQRAPAQGKMLDAKRLARWTTALTDDKAPADDVLGPWRRVAKDGPGGWAAVGEQVQRDQRERSAQYGRDYVVFADFRKEHFDAWNASGQGLRGGAGRSGDYALHGDGEVLIKAVLPAGTFTFALSDKLNGALRSPVIPAGKQRISFRVLGKRSSAVRLVSNNCQLNYANYRALTNDDWQWVTFTLPAERGALRTYAELMTMLDNPKFPDQLSALGGDKENYRLPWEQAAANPRSWFGVSHVVLHDTAEPPKAELSHLLRLFEGKAPQTLEAMAGRYAEAIEAAIKAWSEDRASDDDVRWIEALLRRGLLENRVNLTPRLQTLAEEYRKVEGRLSLPRVAPGLADCGPGVEQPLFTRGDWTRPGEPVARRYLEVLSRPGEAFKPSSSGRLELAERIASSSNPLTARVMVNRLWHHAFGAGLVRTVDDFGRVGELPSHPELLDYLATRFVNEGWSVKGLLRELVMSEAFRRDSRASVQAREVDPLNRLLSHYAARRLEAEAIRDNLLAVSGRLDRSLYGQSIQPYRTGVNADRRLFPGPLDGNGRRGVYIKNNLMEAPHFLGVFNFPGGKVAQGKRDVTNVPAQALALLNDPFVLQQAEECAKRLLAENDATVAARLERLFARTLNRPPTADESERFVRAVAQLAELHGVGSADVMKSMPVWKDVVHAFFNLKEFITLP